MLNNVINSRLQLTKSPLLYILGLIGFKGSPESLKAFVYILLPTP